jgi:hypothetical protein
VPGAYVWPMAAVSAAKPKAGGTGLVVNIRKWQVSDRNLPQEVLHNCAHIATSNSFPPNVQTTTTLALRRVPDPHHTLHAHAGCGGVDVERGGQGRRVRNLSHALRCVSTGCKVPGRRQSGGRVGTTTFHSRRFARSNTVQSMSASTSTGRTPGRLCRSAVTNLPPPGSDNPGVVVGRYG